MAKQESSFLPIPIPRLISFIFFILIIHHFPSTTTADIITINISAEKEPITLVHEFFVTHTGHVHHHVSSADIVLETEIDESTANSSSLGILLLQGMHHNMRPDPAYYCLHYRNHSILNGSFVLKKPGPYVIAVLNCYPSGSAVTLNSYVEIYNQNENGDKSYLREGYHQLPLVYAIFAASYLVFFAYWFYSCYFYKIITRKIHILMAAVILVRFLELFCLAMNTHTIHLTGISSNMWKASWHTFHASNTILYPATFFLISSGWSIFRPAMGMAERLFFAAFIAIESMGSIPLFIFSEETGEFNKGIVRHNFHGLHDIWPWCLIMIMPSLSSIFILMERISEAGEARRSLQRLKRMLFLLIAITVHLLFNMVFLFYARNESYFSGGRMWVVPIAVWDQLGTLLFQRYTFHLFRPNNEEQKDWPRVLLQPEEIIPNAIDERAALAAYDDFFRRLTQFEQKIARGFIYVITLGRK